MKQLYVVGVVLVAALLCMCTGEPDVLTYTGGNNKTGFYECTIQKSPQGVWDRYATCEGGTVEPVSKEFIDALLVRAN